MLCYRKSSSLSAIELQRVHESRLDRTSTSMTDYSSECISLVKPGLGFPRRRRRHLFLSRSNSTQHPRDRLATRPMTPSLRVTYMTLSGAMLHRKSSSFGYIELQRVHESRLDSRWCRLSLYYCCDSQKLTRGYDLYIQHGQKIRSREKQLGSLSEVSGSNDE